MPPITTQRVNPSPKIIQPDNTPLKNKSKWGYRKHDPNEVVTCGISCNRRARHCDNTRIDLDVAAGDLITTVIAAAKEVHWTLDWTDPKTPDGRFQTLSCNVSAPMGARCRLLESRFPKWN